ncbi:hypothetical protein RND81_08G102700 [Saponaria officinalis]|uniref:Uncharacterized protein n=1 Tax=Saponaria officinalis TaxID=3572 RepID=A0AAW1J632_SAPOF
MASDRADIHNLVPEVLPVIANRITIPFHPVLKQITNALQFPEPVYHVLDLSKNNAYVSVKTSIMQSPTKNLTLTYVGGTADTIEDSCEVAAKKAVHDLIKKWGILVEDLTYEQCGCLERCGQLYRLKCTELQSIVKGEDRDHLEEHVPGSPVNVRHVFLDYMPLLRKIFRTVAVQCTALETVKHCADRYTSWMIIQPLFNSASKRVFIGPSCDTLACAKNYLAKKVIMYLIPAYNLEIIDVNYQTRDSKFASLRCNMELESYLSIRGRMFQIVEEPAFSSLLIERDEMGHENATADIPTITPAPVKTKAYKHMRLASSSNMVVCQAGPYPVYYKVPTQQETNSKRARNS